MTLHMNVRFLKCFSLFYDVITLTSNEKLFNTFTHLIEINKKLSEIELIKDEKFHF